MQKTAWKKSYSKRERKILLIVFRIKLEIARVNTSIIKRMLENKKKRSSKWTLFSNVRFIAMFIKAVSFLFLIKLWWQKKECLQHKCQRTDVIVYFPLFEKVIKFQTFLGLQSYWLLSVARKGLKLLSC